MITTEREVYCLVPYTTPLNGFQDFVWWSRCWYKTITSSQLNMYLPGTWCGATM